MACRPSLWYELRFVGESLIYKCFYDKCSVATLQCWLGVVYRLDLPPGQRNPAFVCTDACARKRHVFLGPKRQPHARLHYNNIIGAVRFATTNGRRRSAGIL